MNKPRPEDYGFDYMSKFDAGEESGWKIEGGEESYEDALERWHDQIFGSANSDVDICTPEIKETVKQALEKYEIHETIVCESDLMPKEFFEKNEEALENWQREVIEPTYEEKRAFGLHMKYGITESKTKYIKPKVEGWRLVLKEGNIETTLPNMNDKPYAYLQSEKNKLERDKSYPKGKLIIKPKI